MSVCTPGAVTPNGGQYHGAGTSLGGGHRRLEVKSGVRYAPRQMASRLQSRGKAWNAASRGSKASSLLTTSLHRGLSESYSPLLPVSDCHAGGSTKITGIGSPLSSLQSLQTSHSMPPPMLMSPTVTAVSTLAKNSQNVSDESMSMRMNVHWIGLSRPRSGSIATSPSR